MAWFTHVVLLKFVKYCELWFKSPLFRQIYQRLFLWCGNDYILDNDSSIIVQIASQLLV